MFNRMLYSLRCLIPPLVLTFQESYETSTLLNITHQVLKNRIYNPSSCFLSINIQLAPSSSPNLRIPFITRMSLGILHYLLRCSRCPTHIINAPKSTTKYTEKQTQIIVQNFITTNYKLTIEICPQKYMISPSRLWSHCMASYPR